MDKKKPPSHGADILQTAIGGVEKKVEKSEHGADAHPTGHSGVSQNARYGVDAHPIGGAKEPIAEALVHGGDLFSTGGSSVRESARTAQALFFGRYEMLEKLGHGGMAEVWRVYDHQRKQDVALKRMSIHLQESEEAQRRFFREITLLQGLKHPHIIAIYEASPEGFFFTMELLQGQDLRQFLLERKRLPLHLALSIFGQVGQALLVAHQAGVVHRDLKPENIFLLVEPPSFVKLLDFGIAVALEGTRMTMTQQGQLGTAYYMAPEQLHGEHQEVGAAADVYSCGVLLYELLTGRIPQIGAPSIQKHIERLEAKGQLGREEFSPALRDAYYNHLKELEKAYQRAIPNEPEDRSPLRELVTSVASSFSAWTQQRQQAAKQQIAQILAALEQSQEKQVIESLLPELRASFPEQAQVAEFSESLLQARQERDALVKQLSVKKVEGTPFWEERAALWQASTDRAAYRALYTQHPFTMRLQKRQRNFAEALKQSRSLAEHQSPVDASIAWKKQAYHFQAAKDWMALLERESERQRKCEEATQTLSQNLSDPWPLDVLQEHLSFWECAATESAFPSFFREHPAIREFQEAVQEEAKIRRLQQEGTPEDFFSALQHAKGRVWPTDLAELRASVEASQQENLRLEKQTQAFLDAVQPKAWEEGEALKQQWDALASQDHISMQCVQRNMTHQKLNERLNKWKQLEAAVAKADFATFEALLGALKGYTSPQIEHYRQQYNAYQETYRELKRLAQNDLADERTTAEQHWTNFLASTELSALFANSPAKTVFSWEKEKRAKVNAEFEDKRKRRMAVWWLVVFSFLVALFGIWENGRRKEARRAEREEARREEAEREEASKREEEAEWRCIAEVKKTEELSKGWKQEGKVFEVGKVKIKTRRIRAGTFLLGGQPSYRAALQHCVTISQDFWMMETEVTQGQYKALMGSNPSHFSSCGDNCPVENVTWYEARAFADKLSQAQGLLPCKATDRNIFQCKGWRLPTETEWEYAARAGTTTAFHTGGCISTDQANYDGNDPLDGCPKGKYRGKTIEVCSLARNQWGFCDMHGNVWEWTMDVYNGWYEGFPIINPLHTGDRHQMRVYRGGGWDRSAFYLHSAGRFNKTPSERDKALGFRLLRYSYPRQSTVVTQPMSVKEPATTTVVETPAVAKEPTAGTRKTFTAGGVGFAMRWIPSGSFMMGSPSDEEGRFYDEGSQHRVEISKGFWMLETEVTQGQYKALMGSNPSHFSSCGDNCPVENVSWYDARAFADKLSQAQELSACTATNRDIFQCKGWRLPTEAEWEYAARAGTTGARHGELSNVAWHGGNSDGKAHPVGKKEANTWGLHDMLGNVLEWTMDVHRSYAGLATKDPLHTDGGTKRVIRGGGCGSNERNVRSALRNSLTPTFRFFGLGFRLVRYSYPRPSAAVTKPIVVETPAPPTVVKTPTVVKEPTAGTRKTFTAGGVRFAMRWIPPGSFVMGSPSNEEGRFDDEGLQRRIKISKGFWMLETEVTQGQYKALVGSNPSGFSSCGDNCPVESVSWHDARAFADKLSQAQELSACTATNRDIFQCKGWRLPTEAEWEYAARAGTTGARHGELSNVAWHGGNSDGKAHPVGKKEANTWGLHDMLGNVWEWTMDVYVEYAGLQTTDPLHTDGGAKRVNRGGSWYSKAKFVRPAVRFSYAPSSRSYDFGFRLIRY